MSWECPMKEYPNFYSDDSQLVRERGTVQKWPGESSDAGTKRVNPYLGGGNRAEWRWMIAAL